MKPCLESEGRTIKEQTRLWMIEYWGERCPDCDTDCPLCNAWKSFDVMFSYVDQSCGDDRCEMPGCQPSSSSTSVRTNP